MKRRCTAAHRTHISCLQQPFTSETIDCTRGGTVGAAAASGSSQHRPRCDCKSALRAQLHAGLCRLAACTPLAKTHARPSLTPAIYLLSARCGCRIAPHGSACQLTGALCSCAAAKSILCASANIASARSCAAASLTNACFSWAQTPAAARGDIFPLAAAAAAGLLFLDLVAACRMIACAASAAPPA